MSEYDNMTVAELKELLKDAGLPVSGKKADLIARLEEAEGHDDNVEEEIADEADDDFDDYDDDEDWDDDEEYFHVAKQKPVLDDATKSALEARKAQRKSQPKFRRQEWFRYRRLSRTGWRKPKGMDNKQRRNYKYRGSLVRIGHGKVAAARFLHPSGFREVMVHNTADLEAIEEVEDVSMVMQRSTVEI